MVLHIITAMKITPIVLIMSLVWQPTAKNAEFSSHDMAYSVIRRLQPKLSIEQAIVLSEAFVETANTAQCHLPWPALVGVAFKESSLISQISKTGDYGVMQINKANIVKKGLDFNRIMTDTRHSIEIGCEILTYNKMHYGSRSYWLGIYNAGLYNVDRAAEYDRLVRDIIKRKIGYRGKF